MRFHRQLKKAEALATEKFGTGPGAVRFISGTLKIHRELEKAVAKFHQKEEGMIFSSAFAANQGVIFPLIIGQRKNTIINDNVLVISDELNHRSIIDAIRLAKLPKENKAIFKHLNMEELEALIKNAIGRFDRVMIITDGVFSMLGEVQDLRAIQKIKNQYEKKFPHGILLIVDDAHGVGVLGEQGRGSEEFCQAEVDILIGTFGKAFGSDGGYAVAKKVVIDYLRESAATYIYSNSLTPATTAASLKAIKITQSKQGARLRKKLQENIAYFKKKAKELKIPLATDSPHPIQPVLIGDSLKTKQMVAALYQKGFLVTAINYPVVPAGKEEIRIQLSSHYNKKIIDLLLKTFSQMIKQ